MLYKGIPFESPAVLNTDAIGNKVCITVREGAGIPTHEEICLELQNLDQPKWWRAGLIDKTNAFKWYLARWDFPCSFLSVLSDDVIRVFVMFKNLSAESYEMYAMKMMMHGWHVTDPVVAFFWTMLRASLQQWQSLSCVRISKRKV